MLFLYHSQAKYIIDPYDCNTDEQMTIGLGSRAKEILLIRQYFCNDFDKLMLNVE
jgi:hypothetical protein